jgi:hypothetical protein
MDNRMDKVTSDIKAIIERKDSTDMNQRTDEIVDYFAKNFFSKRHLLREIFLLAPETGRMEALYLGRREVLEALEKYLLERAPEKGRDVAHDTAFMAVHGAMGVVESYVLCEKTTMTKESASRRLKELLEFNMRDYR